MEESSTQTNESDITKKLTSDNRVIFDQIAKRASAAFKDAFDSASIEDEYARKASRLREMSAFEPGTFEAAKLGDDPSFVQLLETMREQSRVAAEQLDAFKAFVDASDRDKQRQSVLNRLSLAVAVVSLAVTFVSLLGQFGVIG